MYVEGSPSFRGIDEELWLKLVDIACLEFTYYRPASQMTSYENPEEMAIELLSSHYKVLSSLVLDKPHDYICAFFRKVVRNYIRNNSRRRQRLVSFSPVIIIAPRLIRYARISFHPLRHSARSLSVRLITCAKDRLLTVMAKFFFDRFACERFWTSKAREQITRWQGI
jgi:hypothetical protein